MSFGVWSASAFSRRLLLTNLRQLTRLYLSNTNSDSLGSSGDGESDPQLPPLPTDCCMSGCANCVWISYAEELAKVYRDGGRAGEKVLEAIQDPSLRIFISLELREKFRESEE